MAVKGKTMDLVGAWTVQDVLLCLLWLERGRPWTWCLDCSGYTALSAVAGKEKTMDLVDAWTVQDMLLCLL